MFILFLLISAFLTVGVFYSKDIWWLDMLSHFRPQYLILQSFFCILFLMVRNWLFLLITLIFVVINAQQILPLYHKEYNLVEQTAPSMGTITIILTSANGTSARSIMDYIFQKKPHILALTELDQNRLTALAELVNQYKFQKYISRHDGQGFGILSDWEIDESRIESYGNNFTNGLIVTFKSFGKPFSILLTQLSSPRTKNGFESRNLALFDIAANRKTYGENLILLGNLNMTSWTENFSDFLQKTNLIDTRTGYGIQGTWPAQMPVLMLPLDHCLISANFRIVAREVGPYVGTDHLPIFVELDLLKQP